MEKENFIGQINVCSLGDERMADKRVKEGSETISIAGELAYEIRGSG